MEMKHRITGFDLARAYAIFGMFIVNFTFCFGSFKEKSLVGGLSALFVGNSTAVFIILAGMGVSLMTNRISYEPSEQIKLRFTILRRSWFLFALGLLLYPWWPGDILHFYGGYMHIAAFVLFIPKKYYLWIAFLAILIFHILLQLIPVTTNWNFQTYRYADFWTPIGFLRNTFYNGWNSVFPWLAYFVIGMFLGRLNWQNKSTKKTAFIIGLLFFGVVEGIRYLAKQNIFDSYWASYIMAEYFPAYPPFIMVTVGFALMAISACMFISDLFPTSKVITALVQTGRMTLTWYVAHLTIGMIVLSKLSGNAYTGYLTQQAPVSSIYVISFVVVFYMIAVAISVLWLRKFSYGPLESIMRLVSR